MRDPAAIQNTTYDLIIIGAGINGAGVARDAALRGLKTLLLDKGDFGGGTTSWSTRLIHGGLRYLESFEFDLVRQSLREREILLRAAPHLVKPLLMTIPIYRSGSRRYWEVQAGMVLYDLLSFDKTLPVHRMLSAKAFRRLFPQVDAEDLTGAAQYYDAQVVYAERLCLENVLAAQAAGATVLNYVGVIASERAHQRITALTCRDELTGSCFVLSDLGRAVVINASGPWVDRVLDLGDVPPQIGGTKGSHILVDPFPGSPSTALYVEAKADRRPFFIVPWADLILIGTTDIPFAGDLDRVKASDAEIDYLLAEANRILPTARLSRQQVRFTYSGVRPLPYSQGKAVGKITRRHILNDHAPDGIDNLLSLVGGKLTTFRQVGQELVEAAYRKLGRPAPPCPTLDKPLPGAIEPSDPRIAQATREYRLPAATIHHLFCLYGARAPEVLALTDQDPSLAEPIAPPLLDISAQIVYAVQAELAQTLADICLRRTTLAMQADYGLNLLPAITEVLIRHCGWDPVRSLQQVDRYRAYLEAHCLSAR